MTSKRNDNQRRKKRYKEEIDLPEQNEYFAFIAGYTSGGVPYGITWEEWEQMEKNDEVKEKPEKRESLFLKELPFD